VGAREGQARVPASHRALATQLLAELSLRDPDGSRLALAGDLRQAATLAADRMLDPSLTWSEQLGACYDVEGVRQLLARDGQPISRQAVHKRRGLLALTTGSGKVVYPAFQFAGRSPIAGLERVLDVLAPELVSRWTVASWLVSPEAQLDGERPIDVLQRSDGVNAVVAVAAAWSAALAA
jgi:hypothetical protein